MGSGPPTEERLASLTSACSSNWNLALLGLPEPSLGTSRGQPAHSSGRGSRNSWSQRCANGQEAPTAWAPCLGKWPVLLGQRLPCLRGQSVALPLPTALPNNHSALLPLGGEEPALGGGKKRDAAISNNSCQVASTCQEWH